MSLPRSSAVLMVLSLVLAATGAVRAQPADVMRVHFIDVGQGLAALVEFPCGAVLIDAGGERWPNLPWRARFDGNHHLFPYLRELFARRTDLDGRLDLLVLTHPHADHTRGVSGILRDFEPRNVLHNGQTGGSGSRGQRALRRYDERREDVQGFFVLQDRIGPDGLTNAVIDPVAACAATGSTGSTDPRIRVLWGQVRDGSGWSPSDFRDGNNHSLVIRIDYGAASILFTGDLEEQSDPDFPSGIERLLAAYGGTGLLDVDVYQVGHHGSHNGTTPAFLQAMSPKMAVIAAGPSCEREGFTAWTHGHPREVTVQELEAAVSLSRPTVHVQTFLGQRRPTTRSLSKAVYSTGWDGTVVLEARPDGWWEVVDMTGAQECSD